MIVALSAVNAVHAVEVTATISVGTTSGGHYGIAYDSGRGEIFVTNLDFNSVSVISDSTNTVVATITVGSLPWGIAYDSGKGEIFVANYASDSVSVISDSSLPPVPEFTPAAILILATATCIIAVAFRKKLLPTIYKGAIDCAKPKYKPKNNQQ